MMQVLAITNVKESSFLNSMEQLQQSPIAGPVSFRDANDGDWQFIEELADNLLAFKLCLAVDIVGLQRRIVLNRPVPADTVNPDGNAVNKAPDPGADRSSNRFRVPSTFTS